MTDFARLPDLASRALGGAVVAANDEFFAAKENLVLPEPAAVARPEVPGVQVQGHGAGPSERRRGRAGSL